VPEHLDLRPKITLRANLSSLVSAPEVITIADFNGDGTMDIAADSRVSVTVLLNRSDERFSFSQDIYSTGEGNDP
jgi:hypothetical protein